jgi:hypothetical protein
VVKGKPGELPSDSIARANRQRIAAEEGRLAWAEVERKANPVRDNMARLRALREAEEMRRREVQPPPGSTHKPSKGKVTRKQAKR